MSFKDKIMNVVVAHPMTVTFGIELDVTFGIGMVLGTADNSQAQSVQTNQEDQYHR